MSVLGLMGHLMSNMDNELLQGLRRSSKAIFFWQHQLGNMLKGTLVNVLAYKDLDEKIGINLISLPLSITSSNSGK